MFLWRKKKITVFAEEKHLNWSPVFAKILEIQMILLRRHYERILTFLPFIYLLLSVYVCCLGFCISSVIPSRYSGLVQSQRWKSPFEFFMTKKIYIFSHFML